MTRTCLQTGRGVFQPFLPEPRIPETRIEIREVHPIIYVPIPIIPEEILLTTCRIVLMKYSHACPNNSGFVSVCN